MICPSVCASVRTNANFSKKFRYLIETQWAIDNADGLKSEIKLQNLNLVQRNI